MLSRWSNAAALLMCLPVLAAAQNAVVTTPHMRAELIAHAPEGIGPGKPMWLGLSLQHAPHWHTYWKNAGDSGLPTTVSWQLPSGAQAGEIAWPTPKQLKLGPLMNYGYEDTVLLPVPVTVSGDFSARSLAVKLRADWLVCREVCIPESGEFTLALPAATAVIEHQEQFTTALARVPRAQAQAVAKGRVEGQALVIEVSGLPATDQGKPYVFFPETGGVIEPAAPIQQSWNGGTWSARVPLSAQRSESPSQMQAVLVAGAATGIQVRMDIAGPWPIATPDSATPAVSIIEEPSTSLLATLGLALLGGLLLNLMPCVFPVLSLKLLSFAKPGQRRRDRVAAGLAYTVGVLVSFVALAGLLLALRAGGEQLGWGFQLQSPLFVAALALLFTLIGLNLAGLFELRGVLPGNLASMRARHPLADHALTGALAVAVASPCTGPFMGVALGSALTLPAGQALLVFAALGFGMAMPYLAIALLPGIARRLPRPGPWMHRFKVAMAFPMFATVLWLVWVLGQQVGIDGAVGVLAVLLATALVGWTIGMPEIRPRARAVGNALAAAVWLATLAWAFPALREPAESPSAAAPAPAPTSAWQPWSADAVTQARAQGRPVFVDFTAAWCVTCQFNKRNALADAGVMTDFIAHNVLLLRADWTRRDPAITQELTRLGRSGVPVYALYDAGTAAPTLLPEILRASVLRQALAALPTRPARAALSPV